MSFGFAEIGNIKTLDIATPIYCRFKVFVEKFELLLEQTNNARLELKLDTKTTYSLMYPLSLVDYYF